MATDHRADYTAFGADGINEPSEDDWLTAEQLGLTEEEAREQFPWAEPRVGEGGRLVWSRVEIGLSEDDQDG